MCKQSLEMHRRRAGHGDGQPCAVRIVRIDAGPVVAAVDLQEDVEDGAVCGVKLFYRT